MKGTGQWRRVNRGRGHSYYDPDGQAVPGVTTLLRAFPKPQLVDWAARSVAEWAGDFKDEFGEMRPSEVTKAALDAFHGGRRGAMAKGKTIHELAEHLLKGEEVEVAPAEERHVDRFLEWVADFRVEPVACEAVIVNRGWSYCGTCDLIAYVDGQLALVDYKTGASGVWPETALQLAAYAWSEAYLDPVSGDERTMPLAPDEPLSKAKPEGTARFDLVAALWLQDDKYELVPVDAGKGTWQTFLYVAQLAAWMETPREEIVLPALAAKEMAK